MNPPKNLPWWRSLLHSIGKFQSAVLLAIIYLVLWLPTGLLARVFADWLCRKPSDRTQWQPRPERFNQPSSLREPF